MSAKNLFRTFLMSSIMFVGGGLTANAQQAPKNTNKDSLAIKKQELYKNAFLSGPTTDSTKADNIAKQLLEIQAASSPLEFLLMDELSKPMDKSSNLEIFRKTMDKKNQDAYRRSVGLPVNNQ